MLTVMCPNCRHRFPAPGCCTPMESLGARLPAGPPGPPTASTATSTLTSGSLSLGQPQLLGVGSDASSLANNLQRQQVRISTQCGIQSGGCLIQSSNAEVMLHSSPTSPRLEVRSKLSGGGGCLVQQSMMDVDYPQQEQQQRQEHCRPLLIGEEQLRSSYEQAALFHRSHSTTARLEPPPSGCQELPGTRRESPQRQQQQPRLQGCDRHCCCCCSCCCYTRCCHNYCRNSSKSCGSGAAATASGSGCRRGSLCQVAANDEANCQHQQPTSARCRGNECTHRPGGADVPTGMDCDNGDVRIQVNATVQMPAASNVGSCTFNITASTSSASTCTSNNSNSVNSNPSSMNNLSSMNNMSSMTNNINDIINNINNLNDLNNLNNLNNSSGINRLRNNFNGGGIVTLSSGNNDANVTGDNREEAPRTPVSWLGVMPCPWSAEGYLPNKEIAKLAETRRLLQTCGWFHEGLTWQQSETLLKDAPVGRWFMRDSSDIRYAYAISVQTERGPTSVRVFYFMGKFRLDAEPRLALAMPLFDCPIKMLEYYCEYSKRMDEHRKEVWVDYSGQIYSPIYLSEPLVTEVRSLSQLARIAVNKNSAKLEKERERLPPVIRKYLNEYPYTL